MNPNEYYGKVKSGIKAILHVVLPIVVMVFLFVLLVASLGSCSPKVVTVPEYHTQYVNRTDTFLRVDSVVHNTNVIIREANKNDSAMLVEYGIKLKDNERVLLLLRSELDKAMNHQLEVRTDTFIKTDSIPMPYPVEKKVPAELSWWQKLRMHMGDMMIMLLIAALLYGLYRIKKSNCVT